MRILITNDDGIGSPGLTVLEQIAAEISNDVWVVAPEADCSDAFGAPTICKPLKLDQLVASAIRKPGRLRTAFPAIPRSKSTLIG